MSCEYRTDRPRTDLLGKGCEQRRRPARSAGVYGHRAAACRRPASSRVGEARPVGAPSAGHGWSASARAGSWWDLSRLRGSRRPPSCSPSVEGKGAEFGAFRHPIRSGKQIVGPEVGEDVGPADDHPTVRTKELVRRAREEVGAEIMEVDGAVGCVVHAVDVQQGTGRTGARRDGPSRRASCRSDRTRLSFG